MIENKAKRTLAAGKPVLAVTLNFLHAGLAEYLTRIGFDCLVIDAEHGIVEDDDVEQCARACELTGATLLVRMPFNNALMQRYLGLGVAGFHVAQTSSLDQTHEIIDAVKFPPAGKRGIGTFRAADFGLSRGDLPSFMKRANAETFIMLTIEDPGGVAAMPEIVKLPEIDSVMFGFVDLSLSLGFEGRMTQEIKDMRDSAFDLTVGAGKAFGAPARSPEELQEMYDLGSRFVLTSVSRLLLTGAETFLRKFREISA